MTKFEAIATELNLLDPADLLSTHPQIDRSSQVGFNPEKLVPKLTYVESGVEKLTALCNAVGIKDKTAQAIEIFRAMTVSWGDRSIRDESAWKSDVSDDLSPFEFSIAFKDDQAELRVLLEAQGTEPTLQSNWQAGLKLNQYLAEHFNVSLDRFRQIEDLFVPTNPDAKFSMWHAACFSHDKEPVFKIYLNPQAKKRNLTAAVVEESLVRLGFPFAWAGLADIAAQRGPDKDDFPYFSLDLTANTQARVKVYLRHYDATADDLEKALSLAQNYVAGDATEFCQDFTQTQGSFTSKPIVSCFSFIEGTDYRPTEANLYIPIGYYAPNDQVVADRLHQYFSQHNLPTLTYTTALQAFAIRSLDSGVGMHSHISLNRKKQHRRVTVYLNPEIDTVRPINENINESMNGKQEYSIESIARHYEANSFGDHPFFQRLQREPVNLTHLWLLFANGQEGVVAHFTRRLALVVAHIDNEHICCVLAKQLNEELGNGDVSRIHRKIFERLILSIKAYKPQLVTEEMLAPGHKLSQRLESLYSNPNAYVGVGAAIVMELRGQQRDEVLGKELARTKVTRDALSWLDLHGELEADHAEEAMDLARLIDKSDGDRDAALQGASMTSDALWEFCNGMYQVCFM
jgi:DMATS type aromatic prenyltransferase